MNHNTNSNDHHQRRLTGGVSLTSDSIWHHDDDDDGSVGGASFDANSVVTSSDRSGSYGGKRSNGNNGSNCGNCGNGGGCCNNSIWNAKTGVLIILLVSAIAIGTVAYLFTSKEETGDFEDAVRRLY